MAALTRVAAVMVSGLLLTAGCATNPPSHLPETVRANTDNQGLQHVTVVAGSYYFRPSHIIVQTDAPVLLSVRKEWGIVPHTFFLHAPQAGITVDVPLSTEARTVTFTPTRAGRYEYYCSQRGLFGSHREKGMEGVLEVIR